MLKNIFENTIANIITAFLFGLSAYVVLYYRMSGFRQTLRNYIHPKRRVFAIHPKRIRDVEKHEETPFLLPVSLEERDLLVKHYSMRNGSRPHNGIAVRLDSLTYNDNSYDELNVSVSKVGFYDFIATNLTAYPANSPIQSFRKQISTLSRAIRLFPFIQQVMTSIEKYGSPKKVRDVLENKHLANIVAVSVLLIDRDGNLGIVKRTTNVAISSGNFSATCAGTVGDQDFEANDPFLSCALRELIEELNISLETLSFDGIVVPKQKMQPIFLYHAMLDQSWEKLMPKIELARDIRIETQALYSVPKKYAVKFAAKTQMTDTASYQIYHYAKTNGIRSRWYPSLLIPMRLSRFVLPWSNLKR